MACREERDADGCAISAGSLHNIEGSIEGDASRMSIISDLRCAASELDQRRAEVSERVVYTRDYGVFNELNIALVSFGNTRLPSRDARKDWCRVRVAHVQADVLSCNAMSIRDTHANALGSGGS
jgi:hypothetical protein